MAALTGRVDALTEAQARTDAQLAALTGRVDALTNRLGEFIGRVDVVVSQVGTMAGTVGMLSGRVLELLYARRAPAYLSRLAARVKLLDTSVLGDLLHDAAQDGRLTEAEREDLLNADLMPTGRRRADQAEIYLLVEVSVGIGPSDVSRAAERAATLAKLGRPVLPVVAGEWINPEAVELARAARGWQVLDGRTHPPDGS